MTKTSKSNSKPLRDPLVGTNRRTAQGREIRDLYRSRIVTIIRRRDSLLSQAGEPIEDGYSPVHEKGGRVP